MVHIRITDDFRAKLNVVRQPEPWSLYCLDEFSLDGTANAVMLIGSGICDAVGVFPVMDRCVCVNRRLRR